MAAISRMDVYEAQGAATSNSTCFKFKSCSFKGTKEQIYSFFTRICFDCL